MQVTYFLNGLMFNLFNLMFYIERKWLLIINLAAILPLKSQLSGKFQHFNAIDRSLKLLKKSLNFQKFQLKWKIAKHFLRPKQRAALRKLFILLPLQLHQLKPYYVSEIGFFMEIYRNIQKFAFKVLQECSSWASRNDVAQIFFL